MRRALLLVNCAGVALVLLMGCGAGSGSDVLTSTDLQSIDASLNPPGPPRWQILLDPTNDDLALVSRAGQDPVVFQCGTSHYFDANVNSRNVLQRTALSGAGNRSLVCWTEKPPGPSK